MLNHEGLASWFSELCIADPSFVSEDRLVWISIEGLPFNTWNNNAYAKIISQWGTLSEVDTTPDSSSSAKKICVVTKHRPPEFNNDLRELIPLMRNRMEDGEFKTHKKVDDIDLYQNSSGVKKATSSKHPKQVRNLKIRLEFTQFSSEIIKRRNQKMPESPIHPFLLDSLRKVLMKLYKRWRIPSVGLSGGILCVWNPNVFAKESVTVSDSFVAVRVRSENERFGTIFNDIGAKAFNHFISSSCLIDLPLEGYSFTWALKSGSKMSKLDRFLISEGLILIFPSLATICLDRRLSDHRLILLRESSVDYGPTPFHPCPRISKVDKLMIKAKIQWAIEGDENSKYFYGIINKKRSQLAIRGVFVDGEWIEDPPKVKNEFLEHFSIVFLCLQVRLLILIHICFTIDFYRPDAYLESDVSLEEIRRQHDVVNAVKEFFSSSKFPPGCIRIDESLTLSHLFYADDVVFIGKWDKANVITIVNMLKCFYLASGLKINIQKSKIMGIGTSQEKVDVAANVISCKHVSSPLTIGCRSVLSSSRSGRFTLNKVVLSSLPIYLMSIYKTPVGVLRKMESIRRRFFNGADINENKMSMIAMFGDGGALDNTGKFARSSTWTTIVRECGNLSSKDDHLLLAVGAPTRWGSEVPIKLISLLE
ncbi:RNA-directed DNA polymerase, eukaryota [Tanacetum coccineum]